MKPKTRLEWFLAKIAGDADATGSVTPKTRKEFYLKEIADAGGGSSLPSVTASDNGSVLAVVNGEWDKAAPDPYPGYDVVFKIPTTVLGGVVASDITIEKGTYADAYSKMSKGQPLRVLFYGYEQSDDFWGCCTYDINGLYADEGYNDLIQMQVTGGYTQEFNYYPAYAADNSGVSATYKIVAKQDAYKLIWTESGFEWTSMG